MSQSQCPRVPPPIGAHQWGSSVLRHHPWQSMRQTTPSVLFPLQVRFHLSGPLLQDSCHGLLWIHTCATRLCLPPKLLRRARTLSSCSCETIMGVPLSKLSSRPRSWPTALEASFKHMPFKSLRMGFTHTHQADLPKGQGARLNKVTLSPMSLPFSPNLVLFVRYASLIYCTSVLLSPSTHVVGSSIRLVPSQV